MREQTVTLVNRLGLHARAAAKLVQVAERFASRIELVRDGIAVDAKSILGVLTLAAPCGAELVVRAEGPDAAAALTAIAALVAGGFEEAQ